MQTTMLADHAVIERKLHLPDVTLVCVDTVNPDRALYAVTRSMAWVKFGAAVLITRPDHGFSGLPAGLQVIANDTIRSLQHYSLFMLRGLSPYVRTSHCLIVQWDGFVLDPSMWRDEFLKLDYIGPLWERHHRREPCSCTGGFSLRSRRLLAALLDERIDSRLPDDVCIALEYRDYLERHHRIRYADRPTGCRFAMEDLYLTPSAFGFHGVHNLLCVLSPEDLEDFIANAPAGAFAGFRMRRFIKHALRQHEIELAHCVLRRRRSSHKLDLSEVRLWARLYCARLASRWFAPAKAG